MAGKFEVKKSTNGQFMFNRKAGSHEVILASGFDHEKQTVTESIESASAHALDDQGYERKNATKGSPFFALKAAESGETDLAAYYSCRREGHRTADGATYNPNALTAAYPNLPWGRQAKITNKSNGRTVMAAANHSGPTTLSRIVDVSRRVARQLELVRSGLIEVRSKLIH
jgi:rare lipoprotein A